MSKPLFEELPREQTRHAQVVQRLREGIASGYLRVGDHLPSERELCEQLGVSRTIVREAIRVLAAQGILIVRQGRRAVVAADPNAVDLQPMRRWIDESARDTFADVMDARLILEVASAERAACKAVASDLEAMTQALETLRATPGTPAAGRAHVAFHCAVAHASHNAFLARMVVSLIDSLATSDPRPNQPAEVPEQVTLLPVGYEAHARIFRPIRDHHASAARRAMYEHLSVTIQHIPGLAPER